MGAVASNMGAIDSNIGAVDSNTDTVDSNVDAEDCAKTVVESDSRIRAKRRCTRRNRFKFKWLRFKRKSADAAIQL